MRIHSFLGPCDIVTIFLDFFTNIFVILFRYVGTPKGRRRVEEWIAYHSLLGVERVVLYVRDQPSRKVLLKALSHRSFHEDIAGESLIEYFSAIMTTFSPLICSNVSHHTHS